LPQNDIYINKTTTMKNILISLLCLCPALVLAQNPLEGKAYRTKPLQGTEKTALGAFTFITHTTIAFAKDSVTFISYRRDSNKELPEITQSHYKYKIKDSGIYIDNPNNSHYIFNNAVLVSDCMYDSGKEYYEVAAE
jgi:hypothetical protein